MSTERFVEIVANLSVRGRCINIKEIGKEILHAQTTKQELYRSHYFFDSAFQDHLRVYKTVRGFLGKPIIDTVILDIDKGTDPDEVVHRRTRELCLRLKNDFEIDDINIRPYYSGSGFHLQIPNLWNFQSHEEVKETIKEHFPELDTIYDKSRLIRVANTINYKTQCYKIPLELGELYNSTIEEIIEAAQQPRNNFTWAEFEENHSLERFKVYSKVLTAVNPMVNDGLSPIVTCMQKLYNSGPKKGMRHISMLRMVSAYKRAGIPQSGIEIMMKEWAQESLEIGEVRKVVGDVFKKNYSYSCSDEIMHQFCDERCMFFKSKSFNQAQPEDANSMEDKMKLFALEGDSNVIVDLQKFLFIKSPFKVYKKELIILLGDTGLGKSAFMQHVVTETKRKILYLNFEVGETLMYRRFLQIAHIKTKNAIIEHYLQPSPSSLAGPIEHINMISQRITLHAFESLISLTQYDLIIVDTLECFQTPGITEITPKTEHIAHELHRIVNKYGITIIAIHHVSKGSIQNQDGSRKRLNSHSGKGSGAIEQQADKVILFEGNMNNMIRTVKSSKARDEVPFSTSLYFDAENTFRFYKPKESALLTSSESQEANKEEQSNSSMLYHSSTLS